MARIGMTQEQLFKSVATVLRADTALAALVSDRIFLVRSVPGITFPVATKETPYLDITVGDQTSTRSGYGTSTTNEVDTEIRFGCVVSCHDDDDGAWEATAIAEAVATAIYSSRTLWRSVMQWNMAQEPAMRVERMEGRLAVVLISMTAKHEVRYTLDPA